MVIKVFDTFKETALQAMRVSAVFRKGLIIAAYDLTTKIVSLLLASSKVKMLSDNLSSNSGCMMQSVVGSLTAPWVFF